MLEYGELLPMLAYREGKPVGRIAAIVNRRHNEYHKDKVGFFGYFDFIDDGEVSKALLDAAKSEIKARGLTSMRGPYNPSINDECGLLTEGFDSIPFAMMPFNPEYYLKHYELLGLKTARNLYAYYISADVEAGERIRKIVERMKRSNDLTVRNINMKKLDEELKIIHHLYNVTLDRNWGFVPLTYEDLQHAADDLKAIVDPSMVMIAEKNGVPVGYSMCIPNINEFMAKTKGLPPALQALKFIWLLKTSHPSEARLAALGIHPDYRHLGIAALFYYETLIRGKRKYKGGELSWIDETNAEIMKGMTFMGAKQYKSYRICESPV